MISAVLRVVRNSLALACLLVVGGGAFAQTTRAPEGPPVLFDAPVAHDPTVGKLQGNAGTSGGASTYAMAIAVPPGRADLQPNLSLTYNSRAGNGVSGMGGGLSGLSSIHRCPQTIEQDGSARSVKYDANDRLCLDGQRLVLVSGTAYGATGSVYRTEVDDFTRVTQIGALTGSATCFKAELKTGRIQSYGAPVSGATCAASSRNAKVQPGGSSTTLSWLMEKDEDRVGNNVFYSYSNFSNGEVLVASIDYTGFNTTVGDRRVTFTYAARPTSTAPSVIDNDVSASYLGGGLTMQTRRLTQIDTWVGTQHVRAYKLDYVDPDEKTSSVSQYSGRSLLQSVTECAYDSAEVCHPATGFMWEDAPVTYSLRQPAIPSLPADVAQPTPNAEMLSRAGLQQDDAPRLNAPPPGFVLGPNTFKTVGDLDGDGGRELLAWIQTANSSNGSKLYLMKSQPDRKFSPAVDVTGIGVSNASWNYVDFDGDGRADVLKETVGTAAGWKHLLVWKLPRGAWSTDPSALFRDVTTDVPVGASAAAFPFMYADFDGDGRTDMLYMSSDAAACGSDSGGARPRVSIYLNRIAGSLVDGAAAHFVLAAESSPLCLDRGFSNGLPTYAEGVFRSTDFDGDGRADIFIGGGNPPNRQRIVYVRPGSGGDAVTYESVSMATIGLTADEMASGSASTEKLVQWIDINGDGLEDFVFAQTNGTGTVPSYQWVVRLNKGGTLSSPIATGNATGLGTWGNTPSGFAPVGTRFRYSSLIAPIDVDSDGRNELLVPARIGAMYCSSYYSPPPAGQMCPIQPTSGNPQPNADLPICLTVRLCPVDPASGNEIVPHDPNRGDYNLYARGSPGPTLDQSTYVMHPLRFVVGAVDTATGLPRITVQEVQKDIYGNHVDDMYGDGLSDAVASIGCQWTDCSPVANGATPNTPSTLPDGTSVAALASGRKLFINENAGIGTKGVRPPELLHAAFNGVGEWAAWTYAPLGRPTDISALVPLPLYVLPGANPYVDARHYYFTSSMPVVDVMTQSTAAAPKDDPTIVVGTRSRTFSYQEAMYNRLGRGFQGFRKITETTLVLDDLGARRQQIATTYHQKFPLTGKVQSVSVADPAHPATPYRSETYTWRCNRSNRNELCPGDGSSPTAPQANTVYVPYLDRQLVQIFDLASAESGSNVLYNQVDTVNAASSSATVSGWDVYGNLTSQIVTSSEPLNRFGSFVSAHTVTTTSAYVQDLTAWWLDKLSSKTVATSIAYTGTHSLPAGASAPSQSATTTYEWNADRTPLSQTVQPGVANQELKTTYGYPSPSYGLPRSVTVSGPALLPSPRTTQWTYTKNGTGVAADGYFVLQTTNPVSQTTTTERRVRDGGISRSIDPNNLKTVFKTDAFDRTIQTDYFDAADAALRPSAFTSWTACADGACPGGYGEGGGETYAAWRVTTTQDGYPTTATWYDKLGRVVKASRSGFNGMIQTLTEYDVMGTVKRTSAPHYSGSAAYWTVFDSYDRLGRVTSKTSPGAELDSTNGDVRTTYAYSGAKTAIKVRGTGVSETCTSTTNLCMDMSRSYDVLGRLQQTVQNNGATANYATVDYWYDGAGNPVAVRDPGGAVLKASYNAIGQRTQVVDPDAGTSAFAYDALGELLTKTDARGVQSAHVYDLLGRLIQRTATNNAASDPNLKVIRDIWTYDRPGDLGLLAQTTRQRGSTVNSLAQIWKEVNTYDANKKRLTDQVHTLDGQASPWATNIIYDAWARESVRTYPSGLQVYNPLDAHGYVVGLQHPVTGVLWWTHTAEDAWGNVTAESYQNGISGRHQTYASTGQFKQKKWSNGSTVLDQSDYSYDSFGNLNGHKRDIAGDTSTESHRYDGLQRLVDSHVQICIDGLCNDSWNIAPLYDYSPSGNLTYKLDYSDATPGSYQYGGNGCGPHAVSQVVSFRGNRTYQCDASGNVVGGNTLSSSYDFQNLPWSISRIGGSASQFAYDARSERFKEASSSKNASNSHETWFGAGGFERTVTTSNTTDRHELGPIVITRTAGVDTVYYKLRDRLGSTIAIGTGAADIVQRSYDVFGEAEGALFSSSTQGELDLQPRTLRGFTGHEHLDAVQLIHMNGRVYDYKLGRFLSVDPVIQFPTNSQSLNPYSYVLNNPLAGKDPTGYCSSAAVEGNQLTCTFTPIGSHIEKTATGTIQSNGSVANWSGGSTVGGKLLSGSTMLSVRVLDNGSIKSQQQNWAGPGKVNTTDRLLSPSSRDNVQTTYDVTSETRREDTRESLGTMFDYLYGAGGADYGVPEPPLPLVPLYPAEDLAIGGIAGRAATGGLAWLGREVFLLRGAGGAAASGGEQGSVIIGETMARVEAAAARSPGAKILNDMPDFASMGMKPHEVTSSMMQYNRRWILEQMRSGRPIMDIGRDPNRGVPSIFYQMEQNMLKNYQRLHSESLNVTTP